ncbi:hypothetical protein [Micromonospora sp. LOL_015]|uniref:hypothetical protein n=1 Tax=Micromonospora sp. LOL_015 TaxID=3345416 RepID=UPI003A8C3801
MQPTPTPAHTGPVKPDETGTGPGPVHGTPVPTPRPALDDNPINEATTEIPMIVPKPAHRNGPSPLPPIATQLLGGDGEVTGEPAGDSADDDRDAPAAATTPAQGVPPTPAAGQADDGQADGQRADGQRAETDAEPAGEDSGPVEQDPAADDQDGNGDGDPTAGPAGGTDEPADTDVPANQTVEPDGTDEADRPTDEADPDDDERSGPTAETDDDPAEDEETVTAHGDAGDLFYAAADDDQFDDDEDDEDFGEDPKDDEDDEERAAMLTTMEETTGPAAGHDDQPAVARPARPGDVTLPPITIWTEDAADELRDEWHEIKARFVDEPEVALAQAQSLVGHTVRTLAERLLAEQVELDPHRHSETPDTESMRMALRQYREFLDRLLAI